MYLDLFKICPADSNLSAFPVESQPHSFGEEEGRDLVQKWTADSERGGGSATADLTLDDLVQKWTADSE